MSGRGLISSIRAVVLVVLGGMLLVVACAPAASQPAASQPAAQPAAKVEPVTWRWAVNNSAHTNKGEQERVVADLINQKTNGKIKVEIYYEGAIGAERTAVEGVLNKSVQMSLASSANFSSIVPAWGALDFPFLIPGGVDGAIKFMGGNAIKDLEVAAEKLNLKPISYQWEGHRHLFTTKKEVKTPSDMKGMKLRTTPSKLEAAYVSAFGGNPSVVDFGETYLALKQGIVEGYFVAYSSVVQYKMNDAIGFGNQMAVVPIIAVVCVNLEEFNKLPADLQKQILEAGQEGTLKAIDLGKKADIEFKDALKKDGTKIFEPTEADLKPWKDLAPQVYEKFTDIASKEWVAKAQASAR